MVYEIKTTTTTKQMETELWKRYIVLHFMQVTRLSNTTPYESGVVIKLLLLTPRLQSRGARRRTRDVEVLN